MHWYSPPPLDCQNWAHTSDSYKRILWIPRHDYRQTGNKNGLDILLGRRMRRGVGSRWLRCLGDMADRCRNWCSILVIGRLEIFALRSHASVPRSTSLSLAQACVTMLRWNWKKMTHGKRWEPKSLPHFHYSFHMPEQIGKFEKNPQLEKRPYQAARKRLMKHHTWKAKHLRQILILKLRLGASPSGNEKTRRTMRVGSSWEPSMIHQDTTRSDAVWIENHHFNLGRNL